MKKALLLLVAAFLSGCAPTKELHGPSKRLTPVEIIEAVRLHSEAVSTLQAKGSISFESPSFMNSGSFALWLKKPDSARVDIQGPFGIRVASASFARDHYVFYNSFKNEVNEGDLNRDELPVFMNIRIDPNDVINMFCGMRTFPAGESSPDSFFIKENSYGLLFRHKVGATLYFVDDEMLVITGVEHIDSTGEVWSEERFEFERRDDGSVVPQMVRLTEEPMQSSLSLSYDAVDVNLPVGNLTVQVPSDARRVSRK